MNLSDITKINFGSAGISAVYNGGIKLWPTGTVADNKVMKFTIVSGDTWDTTYISAYTADDSKFHNLIIRDRTRRPQFYTAIIYRRDIRRAKINFCYIR